MTRELLEQIANESGSELPVETITERLVRYGWLLPLRTRNAWEYAPASSAGRWGSSDPWIELRALLEHHPDAPVAVAFESAVWEYGYTSHQPTMPVLAHRPSWRPAHGLGVRTVSYDWKLPVEKLRGLPVWRPATVLVAAASRPAAQRDWSNADDWLAQTARAATLTDLLTEVAGHGTATLTRLGYLLDWAGANDSADAIENLLPQPLKVTFFGPRQPRGRWINRWRLYDSLLPAK